MIKVLFDAHNLGKKAGGIEAYNRNLIDQFKKQNKNIELLIYANKNFSDAEKVLNPPSDHGLYRIFKGLNSATKRLKPNIVHSNNFLPIPAPKNLKKVITIHDLCFLEEKDLLQRFLFSKILTYSIRKADKIIADSRTTKAQIVRFIKDGKVEHKISVIHLGVDKTFRKINKKLAKKFILQKYRIKNNYFLVSGNITPRKNLPLIISLSNYLKTLDASLRIVISGKKPNNIPHPKNVVFLGFVPDSHLNYLYNASLAVLLPSTCEGFGLPIIEASKVKTPIICSDIPAFREIAKNSVLFAKNKNAWFKHLKTVLEGNYPKNLINKAYTNSLSYSWEKTAKETLKVYEKILPKKYDRPFPATGPEVLWPGGKTSSKQYNRPLPQNVEKN